ncbi:HNH endonuclease signature motif containing protein [Microlunatus panaciterrae]|nr:HNH endonuclease signature motif containing protein [Microlunatus panaciterrae]
MTTTLDPVPTAVAAEHGGVAALLDELDAALGRVVAAFESGGLQRESDDALLEVLRRVEAHRNRLALLDHAMVDEVQVRELGLRLMLRHTKGLLMRVLRIPAGEARARVEAAELLRRRTDLNGAPLVSRRPAVAAAQRDGAVSAAQVRVLAECLSDLEWAGLDPDQVAEVETALVADARVFGPAELRTVTEQVTDLLIPDATPPRDDLIRERRCLALHPTRDGSYRLSGLLTAGAGATMWAVLSPLAAPRPEGPEGPDRRSSAQRWHDALADAGDRLLRSGDLPDSGGTPATIIATITIDDLLNRTGHATTADGVRLSAAELLTLASEADLIPAFLSSHGAVLDLGRSRRIANRTLTHALYARDGGCTFPGCEHPAPWCERHHILDWAQGGATALHNMTLLCGYHHREFAAHGWTCRMGPHQLPEWIPPPHVDPQRTPITNHRLVKKK